MRDIDSDIDKKRKRSEQSSISELDTSTTSPKSQQKNKQEKKFRKKANKANKTGKQDQTSQESKKATNETNETEETNSETDSEYSDSNEKRNMEKIHKELKAINAKMSNVLTKGDPELAKVIRETFNAMKEDFLKPVTHRIEVLESRLFERESENDKLKATIKELEKKVEEQENEKNKLQRELEQNHASVKEQLNEHEQYSRRNNLRIDGVIGEENESSSITMEAVVKLINDKVDNVQISKSDIDIAHRVGKRANNKQQIIVKFVSRAKKEEILRNKKSLKGSGVYINEDLTKLNQLALACVRKKMPDEIMNAWTREGRVKYKNRSGNVHTLKYGEYQTWFDLPWPVAHK